MSAKIIKIVLVGDGAVGKTSLVFAFTENPLKDSYEPTIVDVYGADIELAKETVKAKIWDTAVHAEQKWAPEVRKFSTAPFFLVGNKTDLRDAFDLKGRASLRDPLPVTTKQVTPCKISPPHLFGYPSSFNPSTMHLSTYQDPPSSPTRQRD
ncbi:ras-like GTP-binding protein rhoA [Tigriopus californicus]|uniref:ras-like GTP-binding protein rhoA n=1 Tax=Tigriopus californicus TaxID=6832 RepID=UPI0027D9CFE3|nr:ras-like GTP-binding protein rhoA [Tigriopus californicus]